MLNLHVYACLSSEWSLNSSFWTCISGLSQIVLEAQKSVGWYHDESDSGVHDANDGKKAGSVAVRRLLHQVL